MMNRTKCAVIALALTTTLLSGGCAYRADLTQGNFVEQQAVSKLRVGMTPEQVRFILGTPMLVDPFDASRWYYVHYLREGWSDPKIENLTLLFANGVLVDMQGDFKRPASFSQNFNQQNTLDDGEPPVKQ